jgi:ectoine hydroxylase-related dioxygenase (phytanoyl-CoA dioxygenase family)
MKPLSELQREYQTRGYCVAESLLDGSLLAETEHQLSVFIRDIVPHLDKPHVNYTNGQINSIHCLCIKDGLVELPEAVADHITSDNFFYSLAKNSRIHSTVQELLGDDPEFRRAELFAKPPHDGLPSPFHQDNFYWAIADANALTVWMALNDCGEENGALTYYPESHQNGLIGHIDSNAPGSSQKVPTDELARLSEPVAPALHKGDALIHHSLTVHGSAPNRSEHARRGLTLQFKGANSPYDMDLHNHYMGRLEGQIKEA